MTVPSRATLALALLAACSLRPYTVDSATDASSTSTVGTSSTTGATATLTDGPLTTSPTTGGSVASTWHGWYHRATVDGVDIDHAFLDCATQQLLQLRAALLPDECHEVEYGWGLYLHVLGVLHPDGDDPDALDELEVLDVLDDPCEAGSCNPPFDWISCGPWEDVCGYSLGCDVWTQDCPEGQKCMPYSGDGDNAWESLKCVPVVPGAGGVGDPCTAEGGGVSGIDTCAKGHMCWNIDPDTGQGTCVAQCTGTPNVPICPECVSSCTIGADGVLQLCLPNCNPLAQNCGPNDVCIPNPILEADNFICVLDASGDEGQLFDPCEYANACDPGLVCLAPESASECDPQAIGCCLPFCDLDQPACPGVGQQCLPWTDPPSACDETVGICRLPP